MSHGRLCFHSATGGVLKPEEHERSECKRDSAQPVTDVKSCCARLYESDFVRLLLGDSFHPGGLKLTTRLGELLKLGPHSRVLDVACGPGISAVHVAETFGCEVVGIDYSNENVEYANQSARQRGAHKRVRFER